jgi:outer membrane protein assembly factor BamA
VILRQIIAAACTVLVLLSANRLCAQETPPREASAPGSVDTILVTGNTKTKAYVILNEMQIQPGIPITPELLEFDRNRVYSLGLFTRVDLFPDTLGTPRVLHVFVSERWYLFPLPIFGFRDGDVHRFYYGAGFLHNNFQGRNQKLYGSAVFGYNPSIQLSFTEPLIDHELRLYFGAQLSYSRVRNRSEIEAAATGDFDEEHYDANVTLGKRLNLFENAGVNLGYRMVEVSSYRVNRTVSTDGIDRYFYLTVNYQYDSRDLAEYPMRGAFAAFYITKFGLGTSEVDFARYGTDLRKYVPLSSVFTLAGRFGGSMVSGGVVPTYARTYFGHSERIRGYFYDVYEGENIATTSLELRFALLPPRVFQLSGTPIPDEFTIWRFGIGLALFADAGATWFRGEKVFPESFICGYGGGMHFLLPYGIVARIEYAINNNRRGEFIIDFRTAF